MLRRSISIMFLFLFTVCGFANVRVVVPAGLPAISIAKLAKEEKVVAGNDIEYEIKKNADALVVDMLKRGGDIAIVPSNFAALLYNKGLDYKILGTVSWGSIYIASNKEIKDIKDLDGKKIYTFGKGLTPAIVLNTILDFNGVKAGENIEYVASPSELPPLYFSKKADILSLPEPVLSTIGFKDKSFKTNFNLNEMWKKSTGAKWGFPQATLVVKKELLEKDPQLVKEFVKKLENSIDFLFDSKVDEATKAAYIDELNIVFNTKLLKKILPNSNLKYVGIKEARSDYEIYFKTLEKSNKKVIGGKLPDEKIFANID